MAAVGEDDAAWERAIDAATKAASAATSGPKTLTLDGAVKSSTGRLPSPALFERFAASLEELSVAGARLSSLEGMPRLPALRRLSLPDNRLSGAAALAAVAGACGATLRHLDLGNNRFAEVEELEPLAKLGVEALDLEQCPVSKVKGYREKVFALIPSLKYLDGADAEGNERLETDDEDYVEEDDEEGEEGEDGEGEEGEDGEGEEGEEDDGEEGDEEDEEVGEGDDDDEEEDEEGDEEAEDEEDEADDDELDADADDKENIESKAGSSLPNKRKRDNDDDTNGDN
ncbi:acidic leucine-rich nuclear phosphoprotein 32-related protein 2-like [Panicum miliaceum]|uniref:Acidic leucine-rich nuclear phosphoprotein 32-related protein 2-like n=1 Tax=Panicum miliaceum TaxID=4540 RepID=A0A3L6TS77_PANMI|nr:acidic leucine-rich nuclear phosphoprotein 32-related protein 2-like [Panicum miliaceum]